MPQDRKKQCIYSAYQYLYESWNLKGSFQSRRVLPLEPEAEPLEETFSSMVALELMGDLKINKNFKSEIVKFIHSNYKENDLISFFVEGANVPLFEIVPPDIDGTSLGIALLIEYDFLEKDRIFDTIEKIFRHLSENGLTVFFSSTMPNFSDFVVWARLVYLLYLVKEKNKGIQFVDLLLYSLKQEDEIILQLIPYYCSPDTLSYQISRLLKFPELKALFYPYLHQKLIQRTGTTNSILDCAMRTIVAKRLGVQNVSEEKKIVDSQSEAGFWEEEPYFNGPLKFPSFGSREITTAFCLLALEL